MMQETTFLDGQIKRHFKTLDRNDASNQEVKLLAKMT